MPSIDVAMARSLRGGVLERLQDVVASSIANEMQKRDLIGDAQQKASDVKTAFSSWDNCMQAAYCKWPVIAIIVVGSLFLISIITCIVRCACCGMSCCCSCFRCLKCGDCCGCCDPPGGRKHKYLDAPYVPPHHGYQQQAPMQASFPQQAPPRPMGGASGPPQYAEFDMAHKGAEDSLPQMPSWDNAGSKKIMMEEEVEMNQLKPQTAEQKNPRDLHNGGPVSPMSADHRSAYGNQNSQGSSSTYASGAAVGVAAAAYNQRTASPFTQRDQAQHSSRNNTYGPGQHNYQQNQGYQQPYGYQQNQGHGQNLAVASDVDQNRLSDGYGLDQPYDSLAVMPVAAIARHQSPAPSTHGQGFPQPASAGFAEMPSEPTAHSRSPHAGYAEMSSDMHGAQGHSASQHYAEMSAESTMASQARNASKTEAPQQHVFEMPTDQVAPVELDGGFVMPTANSHQAANELPGSDGHRTSPTSPARGAPEGYGMRRQGTGESAAGTFGARRGDNSPVSPDGYGMRRAGTGGRSPAPLGGQAAYGADSRMRSSPAPRSPGPMSPATPMSPPGGRGPGGNPRNSPGPRRTPAPRGDYRYTPSPLNSPGPYGESPYARPPPPREAVNRSYSPGPQRPPLAHPTPVAPPAIPPSSLESPPHSPITNNSGFDFTSGYSRPRTGTNEQSRSPAEQRPSDGRDGYPGFKPYNPNQNAYNGH